MDLIKIIKEIGCEIKGLYKNQIIDNYITLLKSDNIEDQEFIEDIFKGYLKDGIKNTVTRYERRMNE